MHKEACLDTPFFASQPHFLKIGFPFLIFSRKNADASSWHCVPETIGLADGLLEGDREGEGVGSFEGFALGDAVGEAVGEAVGGSVSRTVLVPLPGALELALVGALEGDFVDGDVGAVGTSAVSSSS